MSDRYCRICWEPLAAAERVEILGPFDMIRGYAHRDCRDDAAERAEERRTEDYYGSSTPQTEGERNAHAT
jgi:hypothetical protein